MILLSGAVANAYMQVQQPPFGLKRPKFVHECDKKFSKIIDKVLHVWYNLYDR